MVAQLTSVEKNQEILSLALEDRSSGYEDLVSNSNALLAQIKMMDGWQPFHGPTIRERLLYNETGSYTRYSGYQFLNPTPADGTLASGNAVATDAAGHVYVGGSFGEDAPGTALATRTLPGAGTLGPGRGGFVAQAGARHQECTIEVGGKHPLPAGKRKIDDFAQLLDAGIAHHDVDATQRRDGVAHQFFDLVFAGYVGLPGVCDATVVADGFGSRVGAIDIEVRDADLRALPGERQRDLPADAATRAGYDGHLVGQLHDVLLAPVPGSAPERISSATGR